VPGHPTLADVPAGEQATLGTPDLEAVRVRRLAEMGLRAGTSVTVLLRTAGGGRVIALGDDRIALDGGTLRRLRIVDRSAVGAGGRESG